MIDFNRQAVINNSYQGTYKKVLCVCSAGCLRSPTAAVVLSQPPFNYNTRSCGINKDFAIIPLEEGLLEWADEIVCMDAYQERCLKQMTQKPVLNLNIDDVYAYRDLKLMSKIRKNYKILMEKANEG